MKLTKTLKTFVQHLVNGKITRNDYRWFFIPTIQYFNYKVAVYDEGKEEFKQNYKDTGLKVHFLCFTINIYSKRTPV